MADRAGVYTSFFILYLMLVGCGQEDPLVNSAEGPEVVVERFYEYISEAKVNGGGSPAREAFKLISAERSHYRVEQFLEVIKKYPSGFKVDVGEVAINGTRALVTISYKMPSMFEDGYTMTTEVPLNIDSVTNTWKIDFTGETDSMDQDNVLEGAAASQPGAVQENLENKEKANL
jgi:hypothetical protein